LKSKLYLDTSVISALFDKRTPERMAQTTAAWSVLDGFDVFISEKVSFPENIMTMPFMSP
jgi:predicted nucleic acid-binding protein